MTNPTDIAGMSMNLSSGQPDAFAQSNKSVDLSAIHKPVLLDECVDLITAHLEETAHNAGREYPIIVDCTLGLAGHTSAFLQTAKNAHIIGIDRDAQALELATERITELGLADRFTPVHAAFDEFENVLESQGISTVDAVFMDLGLSSLQIDEADRGFSYSHDAPLDMRMDSTQELTAEAILATYDIEDLIRIFREYGEERFSVPIAKRIVTVRESEPLKTSAQLNQLVDAVIPKSHRAPGNPAKRVFQALRIEVNGELTKLASTLPQIAQHMSVGGRIVVESYHSLEDKITKRFMSQGLTVDVPRGLPVVPDDAQPFFSDITHGAMKAYKSEIEQNPRSASVRLRAVEISREIPTKWMKTFESQVSDPLGLLGKKKLSRKSSKASQSAKRFTHAAHAVHSSRNLSRNSSRKR